MDFYVLKNAKYVHKYKAIFTKTCKIITIYKKCFNNNLIFINYK